MMHAAKGRPRKRGALHSRGSGEGGSTSTIWSLRLPAGPRLSRRSRLSPLDDSAVPASIISSPTHGSAVRTQRRRPGCIGSDTKLPPWAWMIDRQDGQPQAQAMRLGRIERLEEALPPLWVQPWAGRFEGRNNSPASAKG
jgi:hypothetical protein